MNDNEDVILSTKGNKLPQTDHASAFSSPNSSVTGHLYEGSFVRNGVVQIAKFHAEPSPNPNPNPTFRTSELSPVVRPRNISVP